MNFSTVVAYWGAGLSTFLAIRSIYLGRLQIYATLELRVSTDGYFTLKLTNVTPKPVILSHYNFFFNNKSNSIDIGLYEDCHIVLPASKVVSIYIEDTYLNDFKKEGNLFVELHFFGRSRSKQVLVTVQ